MKKLIIYVTLILSSLALAQDGVGIGTTTIDPSAALDMVSTTSGLLINRVSLDNISNTITPINSPAAGLLVYNTNALVSGGDGVGFYSFNGTGWVKMGADPGWSMAGDAGTISGTNFLGTINADDLIIKTNATEAIRVDSSGNIGIGTTNPTTKLHVVGSAIPPTVYSMDFEGSLASVSAIDNSGASFWRIITILPPACNTACTNTIYGIGSGTNEDDVLTLGPFNPMQNSINISFDYGMDEENGGGARRNDRLIVQLFQGGAQVGADLINLLDTNATNASFTGTRAVTTGLAYELRVTFQGGLYAAVDNFLVTQASTTLMRIQDGSEQDGYVLTSDANGFGSWRNPKVSLAEEDWAFFSGSANNDPMYHQGLVRGGSTTVASKTLDLDYSASSIYNFGATTFGVGSVEIFVDIPGLNEITAANNDIAVQVDNTSTLGEALFAWTEVFLSNATITTSDIRLKENINPIHYGIEDVMKLKPSQYFWTEEQYVKRGVPLDQKRLKLGLIAQDLLEVVPEVVTTHQWVKKSEKENKTFVLKENERLGVNYAELIPVLIKATQEQQMLIEKLELENKRLEKLLLK